MATPEIPSKFWYRVYDTKTSDDDLAETRSIFARAGGFPTRFIIMTLGAERFEATERVATKIRLTDLGAPDVGLTDLERCKGDARWLVAEAIALELTRLEIEEYLS